MSLDYSIASPCLIRLAGVPFDSLESLATPESSTAARTLIARRLEQAEARNQVQLAFQSGERSLSTQASKALRVAVRANRSPIQVSGVQPAFFTRYSIAAAAVEAAEQSLDLILARELATARAALLESSRTFLEGYLVFATPGVRDLLFSYIANRRDGSFAQRDHGERKAEQTLLLYLQRVAAKNDTFSKFGPSGWGRVAGEPPVLGLAPESSLKAREIFWERWTANAIAQVMNRDPNIFPELCPRLNPNGLVEDQVFIDWEDGRRTELSTEETEIVKRCDGATPVHKFGTQLSAIQDLMEKNVLRCGIEVPALEPRAIDILGHDVEQWRKGAARDEWSAVFQALTVLSEQFSDAEQNPRHRGHALDRARSYLNELGVEPKPGERFLYSATNPIGEECFRECNFCISRELISQVAIDAAPWIDFWRDCYAFIASRVADSLRRIFEKSGPRQSPIPLPAFLAACRNAKLPLTGPGLVAPAVIAFQEVKAVFREQLRPHAGEAEYELTPNDCHVIRKNFQYPKFDDYTYPSADLQLSAESVDAVTEGRYQWILSEFHPPVAMLHHGVYWSCPEKGALNEALALTTLNKPNFHFGFFAADFTAHTTVRLFDALPQLSHFVAPQRGNPKWPAVSPAETEVFVDEETGDVGLRKRDSKRYLGSFARAWLIPAGFHPFQFSLGPHTPRLRCGRVIVQRRLWTVTSDQFPRGNYHGISPDLVVGIEQLRAENNWPRYVYIRPSEQALRRSGAEGRDKDTKPVFIDLESYLFLEIFHRWLTKAGELEITEMLPDPDHLAWQEADGRRTFELRALIVPRQ